MQVRVVYSWAAPQLLGAVQPQQTTGASSGQQPDRLFRIRVQTQDQGTERIYLATDGCAEAAAKVAFRSLANCA